MVITNNSPTETYSVALDDPTFFSATSVKLGNNPVAATVGTIEHWNIPTVVSLGPGATVTRTVSGLSGFPAQRGPARLVYPAATGHYTVQFEYQNRIADPNHGDLFVGVLSAPEVSFDVN
jgi:hypothetical protein